MSVERTQVGQQVRYELRHGAALVGVLIFGQPEIEPAAWKILLPGPGGTEDLYGTERFRAPDRPAPPGLADPCRGRRARRRADRGRGCAAAAGVRLETAPQRLTRAPARRASL